MVIFEPSLILSSADLHTIYNDIVNDTEGCDYWHISINAMIEWIFVNKTLVNLSNGRPWITFHFLTCLYLPLSDFVAMYATNFTIKTDPKNLESIKILPTIF